MTAGLRYFSFGLVGVLAALFTTGCSIHPPTNCVGVYGAIPVSPPNGAIVESGAVAFWVDDWEAYGYFEGDLVISSEVDGPLILRVEDEAAGEEYSVSVELDAGMYVWWFEGRFDQKYSYTTECLFVPHLLVVQDGAGE
jgi:hypothetical protein